MKIYKTVILKVKYSKTTEKIHHQIKLLQVRYNIGFSSIEIGFVDNDFAEGFKTVIIKEL